MRNRPPEVGFQRAITRPVSSGSPLSVASSPSSGKTSIGLLCSQRRLLSRARSSIEASLR